MKLIISACLAAMLSGAAALAEVRESPLALLREACETGNLARLEQAVKQGVDVNARDNLKQTPLMVAAAKGQASVVKRLVELGADTAAKNKNNDTALNLAVEGDQAAAVVALLECGVKPGSDSLQIAAWLGNCEMIKALLKHGANPNIAHGRATPLREAMNKKHAEAAILLLEYGADPELPGSNANESSEWARQPPLIISAWCNNARLTQMLLDRGADVNARSVDDSHTLPLINAASWNSVNVMPLLLKAGADINATNQYHATALVVAAAAERHEAALWLIGQGADVEIPNSLGDRAIHFAAYAENDEMLRALVKAGARLENKGRYGRTALICAARHGRKKNVELLTQAGADVNASDDNGLTALMYACSRNDDENVEGIIDLLAKAGADVSAKDNHGYTAYAYAADRGNLSVTAALQKHGAKTTPPRLVAVPPQEQLSSSKRWVLAVAAIYKQVNHESFGDIYAMKNGASIYRSAKDKDFDRSQPRKTVEKWWKIKNRKDALNTMQRLLRQGHRQRYQEIGSQPAWRLFIYKILSFKQWRKVSGMQASQRRWGQRNALAWDMCRYVNLVCDVYAAGYINEDEFWKLTLPAAKVVQKNFTSWREMGENHLDGRQIWNGGVRDKRYEECFKLLANPADPNSPWNQLPWDTPLTLD